MRAWSRISVRRWVLGGAAMALLAGLAVGPAQAGDRGSGGVIKPIKPVSGCSARLRGERSQAYWSNVAYQTGEFQAPDSSVHRAGATGRLSQHAVAFDGRDAEGLWLSHATVGYDLDAGELLATRPVYPANVADDVARPGFGVGWSTRAIVGGVDDWNAYPYATDATAYGAYGAEDAVALVRVGPYVVPVDPWTPVSQDGPRATREVRERLERGRQEWLRERGFVGAVRTFVNDATVVRGSEARRVDGPVAKFAGVSRAGDAMATADASPVQANEEADAGSKRADSTRADSTQADSARAGTKAAQAADASGVVLVKPITRISMPHVVGRSNSVTRVVTNEQAAEAKPEVEESGGE